jgi:hypothetical protein
MVSYFLCGLDEKNDYYFSGGESLPTPDFVTVLHAPGRVMTKSIDRRKTSDYKFTAFSNA